MHVWKELNIYVKSRVLPHSSWFIGNKSGTCATRTNQKELYFSRHFFRWFTRTVRRLGFINTSPTYQFTKYGILNREWDGLYYALLDSMNEKALWEHVRVNDLAVKLAIIASNSTLNFYLSKCEHNFPLWTINTSSQSSIHRNHCCSFTGNFTTHRRLQQFPEWKSIGNVFIIYSI